MILSRRQAYKDENTDMDVWKIPRIALKLLMFHISQNDLSKRNLWQDFWKECMVIFKVYDYLPHVFISLIKKSFYTYTFNSQVFHGCPFLAANLSSFNNKD